MSNREITIAVDAMGGEGSPLKGLKGAEIFTNKNPDVDIIFFGNEAKINSCINNENLKIRNFKIFETSDDVKDQDNANIILRSRKNSSIYKGLELIKNRNNLGFVSAGNTAALMILSRLHLGMIDGIDRPAICSLIPNKNDFSIMLDLGANVSVTPNNLLQFAYDGLLLFFNNK